MSHHHTSPIMPGYDKKKREDNGKYWATFTNDQNAENN